MDHSMYVMALRSQSLYAYNQRASQTTPTIRNRPAPASGSDVADRRAGANPILVGGQILNDGPALLDAELHREVPQSPPCSVQDQVLTATDILLNYNASISLSPTRAARIQYLFFQGVGSAYSWISPTQAIQGTKDNWNWNTKFSLSSDEDSATFLTQALHQVLAALVPSYSPSQLNSALNPNQQRQIESVKKQGQFSTWSTLWSAWYSNRQSDGSVAALQPPTPADLPNGSTFLEVTQSQDFTNATAYPNPLQWTPLSINGSQKRYLTMTWNSVRSTCLTGSEETTIKSTAAAYKLTGSQRTDEIEGLFELSQNLTDTQKVIAEFWAGGPGTPSPPGIAIWFWRYGVPAAGASTVQLIYSGLELAIGLFETSRLIWGLKEQFKEARPIQEIRRIYNGQTAIKYDGTTIPANLWVPFQMPNFVTPPFPDFPSGHSGFSQTLANVMTSWFGANLPTQQLTASNGKIVSPMLPSNYTFSLTQFPVGAKSSETQPGLVPANPTILAFTTWQSIANSAGMSRQFGGIHAESAHIGGQSVANSLTPLIRTAWNIALV